MKFRILEAIHRRHYRYKFFSKSNNVHVDWPILQGITFTRHPSANQNAMLRLYRACIRPRLDYGSITCGSAMIAVLRYLDIVHYAALHICCGSFCTIPIWSLYIICNEPFLEITGYRFSLNYYFHVLSQPNHPLQNLLLVNQYATLYQNVFIFMSAIF